MDVVGFGALNFDKLYMVEKLARRGEHQEILGFEERPGGSAANTIAGLANLGLATGFIGAVGGDPEGEVMIEDFKKRGVDTSGISVLKERTGIVIGFVDSEGERTLYPYAGANSILEFHPEQVEYASKARYLHISSFVDPKQFDVQKKVVASLPPEVNVSFSPGILYSRKCLEALMPILRKSSVVFLNEVEIREITGKDYLEGSKLLLDEGVEIVAVTLGEKGCYVRDMEKEYTVKAKKAEVVDTTGAGDAFSSGFLYGLISGKNILEAAKIGNKAAAYCIEGFGARTRLITQELL